MWDVTQTIRTSLLDLREKAYERSGQGSSYLFRVDESWAVDATRQVSTAAIHVNSQQLCYLPTGVSLGRLHRTYKCHMVGGKIREVPSAS